MFSFVSVAATKSDLKEKGSVWISVPGYALSLQGSQAATHTAFTAKSGEKQRHPCYQLAASFGSNLAFSSPRLHGVHWDFLH